MTPERAKEIIQSYPRGNDKGYIEQYETFFNYGYDMTEEEVKTVKKVWDTMPGYTCFANAIHRIARDEVNE